jgi:hypothetical protein
MAIAKCNTCDWLGVDQDLVHQQAVTPGAVELQCPSCGSTRFRVANCRYRGELENGATCNHYTDAGACVNNEFCPSQVFGRINPGGVSNEI